MGQYNAVSLIFLTVLSCPQWLTVHSVTVSTLQASCRGDSCLSRDMLPACYGYFVHKEDGHLQSRPDFTRVMHPSSEDDPSHAAGRVVSSAAVSPPPGGQCPAEDSTQLCWQMRHVNFDDTRFPSNVTETRCHSNSACDICRQKLEIGWGCRPKYHSVKVLRRADSSGCPDGTFKYVPRWEMFATGCYCSNVTVTDVTRATTAKRSLETGGQQHTTKAALSAADLTSEQWAQLAMVRNHRFRAALLRQLTAHTAARSFSWNDE